MGLLFLNGRPPVFLNGRRADGITGSAQAFRVLPDGRREESSVFPLAADVTTLGRSERAGADVVLAYPAVNRRHALIRRRPDGCYIEDLRSRNGTTVNGERLASDAPR